MKTAMKLTLLTSTLVMVSCNEKISPELQDASATSGGGPTTVVTPPSTYEFKVVNTAPTILNFNLHKTGAGNATKKCEITSNSQLSNDKYRASPAENDITCFYEAEELALFYNGFSFDIEASQNTCEYVAYAPFSYYDSQPGRSSGTIQVTRCSEDSAGIINGKGQLDGDGNVITCTTTEPDLASYCQYDYTLSGGPNCDTGVIRLAERDAILDDDDGVDGPTAGDTLLPPDPYVTSQTFSCGGKVAACIQGPIKETILSERTGGNVLYQTLTNTPFDEEIVLPGLIDDFFPSNRKYVNYRRDLAGTQIEYGNSLALTAAYRSAFGDVLNGKSFEPELMNLYNYNKRMNNAPLVDSTAIGSATFTSAGGQVSHFPLAMEPYLATTATNRPNAFYAFYCLDNAYDIKARIRMVVRDWDRILPSSTSTFLERISDIDLLPPQARQDVPDTEEIPGDPDGYNAFNDVADWDDFLIMERADSGLPYNPAVTIWRLLNFTDANGVEYGFFKPSAFPNDAFGTN